MGADRLLNCVVIILLPTGGSFIHDRAGAASPNIPSSHCTLINILPCSTYWRGRPSHLYDITIDTELFFKVMANKDKYMKRGKQQFM